MTDIHRDLADVMGHRPSPLLAFCQWALEALNWTVKMVAVLAVLVALADFVGLLLVTLT